MSENKNYKCENCSKTIELKQSADAPECCGKKMILFPMEHCRVAPHAEMARTTDSDEPCDDGRSSI